MKKSMATKVKTMTSNERFYLKVSLSLGAWWLFLTAFELIKLFVEN